MLLPITHLLQLKRVFYRQEMSFCKEKRSLFLPDLLRESSITQDKALSYNSAFKCADRTKSSGLTYAHDTGEQKTKHKTKETSSVGICLPIHGLMVLPKQFVPPVDPHLAVASPIAKVTGCESLFFCHSSPSWGTG